MTMMRRIALIHTDFQEKFGIPRQSNLIDSLKAEIIFEPEFRDPNEFVGLEGYSHLWLIWNSLKMNLPAGLLWYTRDFDS